MVAIASAPVNVSTGAAAPERPVPLPFLAENIPADLQKLTQFVGWLYELPKGRVNWTKEPYRFNCREHAKTNDPETWTKFEHAVRLYTFRGYDGVGFVFTEDDPYAGIDLDDCRDPETGVIADWAQEVLAELDSYSEVSPSRTGVKVIVRAKLPGGGKRRGYGGGAVEMYDRRRYFCLTGHRVECMPDAPQDRQAVVEKWYAKVFPDKPPPNSNGDGNGHCHIGGGLDADDAELLRRAMGAKNGASVTSLWHGDTTAYTSHSEADLALCNRLAFWTGPDAARLDRLFRQSGLMRPKWDRRHFADGRTYGQATIELSLDGRTEFYARRRNRCYTGDGRASTNGDGTHDADHGEDAPGVGDSVPKADPSALDLLNDTGNAERMARRYEGRLLHCWPWRRWLIWDGKRWRADDQGRAEKAARLAIKRDFAEAGRAIVDLQHDLKDVADDPEKRDEIAEQIKELNRRLKFFLGSMDRKRIDAMLAFARSELPVRPDALNGDPCLLNCNNGTLDLRTGTLREHRCEDYLTTLCPRDYRPDAPRPTFDAFLHAVLPGDGLRRFVQQMFGLGLIGKVHEHVLPILYGSGRNGKTTLVEAVCGALGTDYADAIAPELLLARKNESHPTEVADLYGLRIAIAAETKEGKWLNTAAVERLTGGDRLKARRMREDFWSFTPSHTIFLLTNNRPKVEGQELAIWSRLKLVPFTTTFYKPNELPDGVDPKYLADPAMLDKLLAEAEGILAWIVEGCLDWQRHGLVVPDEVEVATKEYRDSSDLVRQFWADCTRPFPGSEVKASEIYKRFCNWLQASGEEAHVTLMNFGIRVEQLGVRKKSSNGVRYCDVALRREGDCA